MQEYLQVIINLDMYVRGGGGGRGQKKNAFTIKLMLSGDFWLLFQQYFKRICHGYIEIKISESPL